MNKPATFSGLILAALGGVMYILLVQLHSETFREDLPPWMTAALVIAVSGVALSLASIALPSWKSGVIATEAAATCFGYVSIANTFVAAAFAMPVLVPSLEFPILITRWPGVYMVIAYFSFVMVAVLGTLAWMGFYRMMPGVFSKRTVYRPLFLGQIVLTQVGIYVTSISMFLGGYVGSALDYAGAGPVVVGAAMEFAVIPSALFIVLTVVGELSGVVNVLLAKTSGPNSYK